MKKISRNGTQGSDFNFAPWYIRLSARLVVGWMSKQRSVTYEVHDYEKLISVNANWYEILHWILRSCGYDSVTPFDVKKKYLKNKFGI